MGLIYYVRTAGKTGNVCVDNYLPFCMNKIKRKYIFYIFAKIAEVNVSALFTDCSMTFSLQA